MFQPGEIVKFHLREDEPWRNGKFIGKRSSDMLIIEVGGTERLVPEIWVQKFYPLVNNDQDNQNVQELSDALKRIQNALNDVLPGEQVVLKDESILGYYDSVSLERCVFEQRQITGFHEILGWSVTSWKRIPASYHEPEDIADTLIGEFAFLYEAVQCFIETLFKVKLNSYWESQAYPEEPQEEELQE